VAHDVRKLAEWIRRHDGVEAVLHHEAAGTIVVRYDETRAPGKLLQGALLDRLRAIRPIRVAEAQRLEVSIAHEVPGRVRLRVGTLSARGGHDDAVERLAAFVATLPGVERARASPASGSMLVMFDQHLTTARKLLDAIAETPPSARPGAQPAA